MHRLALKCASHTLSGNLTLGHRCGRLLSGRSAVGVISSVYHKLERQFLPSDRAWRSICGFDVAPLIGTLPITSSKWGTSLSGIPFTSRSRASTGGGGNIEVSSLFPVMVSALQGTYGYLASPRSATFEQSLSWMTNSRRHIHCWTLTII